MENKRINTSELDFDGIKASLKNFLEGQSKFSDYNFEGSGLSVLLDLLAYNTHYNALYTNLALNESFLDSASKRNSVVSRAKALGYTPRSYRAATAEINMTISSGQATSSQQLLLPRYSPFLGTIKGKTYPFYTIEDYTAYKTSGTNNIFTFFNIVLKQGTLLQYKYLVEEGTEFIIPNPKADLSTLRVRVQESATSSAFEVFLPSSSLINLEADSLVYFIKEIDNELYQVEFGDSVLGKAVSPGNVVVLEYLTCSGAEGNEAAVFSYVGSDLVAGQTQLITPTKASFGGAQSEDIESIRYNAPHYYSAQNRLVTIQDYKTLLSAYYPSKSINVWGGEDNIPKVYGNVYVSIVPTGGGLLTKAEQDQILNAIIKPRNMMSIHTVFVDPEYIKINLNVNYHYDSNKTQLNANDISEIIRTRLIEYNTRDLMQFGAIFRHSYVTSLIDDSDDSILNSSIKTKLVYETRAYINQSTQYEIYLNNPIFNAGVAAEHVKSDVIYVSSFPTTPCFIDDNPVDASNGVLRLVSIQNLQKVVFRTIGTVNYDTGILIIKDLNILQAPLSTLKFTFTPASTDIVSSRNQIVTIDSTQLTFMAINSRDTSGYKFTGII